MPRLILASASPRRRELLASLGVAFDIVPAPVEEHEAHDADPRALVLHNAALKADWVAQRHPGAFVLGADTTVFVGATVLNKPRDLDDARRMLRLLAGRTHSVFTGLALRCAEFGQAKRDEAAKFPSPSGPFVSGEPRFVTREDLGVESRVTFRPLDDPLIERYLAATKPLDKAGAYGIQDCGEWIIERWDGSLTNIVGLPIEATKEVLTRHGLLAP